MLKVKNFIVLALSLVVASSALALEIVNCDQGKTCKQMAQELFDKKQYASAAAHFEEACRFNSVDSCLIAGKMALEGKLVDQSYEKAVQYLEMGCSKANKESCALLKGIFEDADKACLGGQTKFCNLAGQMAFFGNGTDQAFEKAAQYYEKSCAANNGEGCTLLAQAYRMGQGVEPSTKKEVELLQKACGLKDKGGCFYLGVHHQEGTGLPQSFEKAAQYYEMACDKDNAEACHNLGLLYYHGQGLKQSYEQSLKYFDLACTYNSENGCSNVGVQYFHGQGVEQSFAKAKKYFFRACELGEEDGCRFYANLNLKGY